MNSFSKWIKDIFVRPSLAEEIKLIGIVRKREQEKGVFWDGVWHTCDPEWHSELIKYKTQMECRDELGRYSISVNYSHFNGFERHIDVHSHDLILHMTWNNGDVRDYKGYIKPPVIELCKYIQDQGNMIVKFDEEYSLQIKGVNVILDRGKESIVVNGEHIFSGVECSLLFKSLSTRLVTEESRLVNLAREKLTEALGAVK